MFGIDKIMGELRCYGDLLLESFKKTTDLLEEIRDILKEIKDQDK